MSTGEGNFYDLLRQRSSWWTKQEGKNNTQSFLDGVREKDTPNRLSGQLGRIGHLKFKEISQEMQQVMGEALQTVTGSRCWEGDGQGRICKSQQGNQERESWRRTQKTKKSLTGQD